MASAFLIIDGQLSFMDGQASGSLAVPGAWADMERLADLIHAEPEAFDALFLTMDQHNLHDIGHPTWFKDAKGAHPGPFTLITAAEVEQGEWTTSDPAMVAHTLNYLKALEAKGRYIHTIWPAHCIIGTPGTLLHPALVEAVHGWEVERHRAATWIFKGMDSMVEHYSGFAAEVPNPLDGTHEALGSRHLDSLAALDTIHVAGEASSHCVKATVEDLIAGLKERGVAEPEKRLVLHTNMMSPVSAIPNGPDFPAIAQAFLDDLAAKGATLAQ
jgi:nicotinamidase-related amidase